VPTILPIADLTSAVVGTKGTVSLASVAPSAEPGHYPTLQVYNESGCGLALTFGQQSSPQFIPAGGWRSFRLEPGESTFRWEVLYILAGAPVAAVIMVYHAAHERVSDIGILGNSPVGVGGTIGVTTISSLSQLTEAAGTSVVLAQPTGAPGYYVELTNDGKLVVKCLSGGVLRTALSLVPGSGGGAYSVVVGDAAAPTAVLNGNALTATLAADSTKAGGLTPSTLAAKSLAWVVEGTAATGGGPAGAGGAYYTLITQAITLVTRSVVTISGAFSVSTNAGILGCRAIIYQDATIIAHDLVFTDATYTTMHHVSRSRILDAGSYTFYLKLWVDYGDTITLNKTLNYPASTYLSIAATPTSS